tara:strand:- start:168 stop:395 length:228 start_codon:yes stop_codon:yes gene_type:complete
MNYWELGIIGLTAFIFLIFSRGIKLPKLFYRREDTRRIRSYLDKKSFLNQLESQKREEQKALLEEETEKKKKSDF